MNQSMIKNLTNGELAHAIDNLDSYSAIEQGEILREGGRRFSHIHHDYDVLVEKVEALCTFEDDNGAVDEEEAAGLIEEIRDAQNEE